MLVVVVILATRVTGFFSTRRSRPQRHRAARAGRLSDRPDTVWGLITNFNGYPEWRSDVSSVETVESGGAPTWREVSNNDRITYEAVVWEAPTHLVAKIADKGLP